MCRERTSMGRQIYEQQHGYIEDVANGVEQSKWVVDGFKRFFHKCYSLQHRIMTKGDYWFLIKPGLI